MDFSFDDDVSNFTDKYFEKEVEKMRKEKEIEELRIVKKIQSEDSLLADETDSFRSTSIKLDQEEKIFEAKIEVIKEEREVGSDSAESTTYRLMQMIEDFQSRKSIPPMPDYGKLSKCFDWLTQNNEWIITCGKPKSIFSLFEKMQEEFYNVEDPLRDLMLQRIQDEDCLTPMNECSRFFYQRYKSTESYIVDLEEWIENLMHSVNILWKWRSEHIQRSALALQDGNTKTCDHNKQLGGRSLFSTIPQATQTCLDLNYTVPKATQTCFNLVSTVSQETQTCKNLYCSNVSKETQTLAYTRQNQHVLTDDQQNVENDQSNNSLTVDGCAIDTQNVAVTAYDGESLTKKNLRETIHKMSIYGKENQSYHQNKQSKTQAPISIVKGVIFSRQSGHTTDTYQEEYYIEEDESHTVVALKNCDSRIVRNTLPLISECSDSQIKPDYDISFTKHSNEKYRPKNLITRPAEKGFTNLTPGNGKNCFTQRHSQQQKTTSERVQRNTTQFYRSHLNNCANIKHDKMSHKSLSDCCSKSFGYAEINKDNKVFGYRNRQNLKERYCSNSTLTERTEHEKYNKMHQWATKNRWKIPAKFLKKNIKVTPLSLPLVEMSKNNSNACKKTVPRISSTAKRKLSPFFKKFGRNNVVTPMCVGQTDIPSCEDNVLKKSPAFSLPPISGLESINSPVQNKNAKKLVKRFKNSFSKIPVPSIKRSPCRKAS